MPQELITTAETAWLRRINKFQRLSGGAGGGSGFTYYNNIGQYSLLSADTLSLPASTTHSISFSVILGTTGVSLDGGSTYVDYPVGSNITWAADTTIAQQIDFLVAGSASDGNNIVNISVEY